MNNHARELSPNSIEIDKLKALIHQEEQLREAAERSYNELLSTSKQLEKRMNQIDEEIQYYDNVKEIKLKKKPPVFMYEGNEWRTRFENQEEINRQLAKQISLLDSKLEETKTRSKNIKSKLFQENNKDATPEFIFDLEYTKESLLSQLKDYAWRIEQENKAYHKANEERKELHQEILDVRNQFNIIRIKNTIHSSGAGEPLSSRRALESQLKIYESSSKQSNQSNYLPSIYTSVNNSKRSTSSQNDNYFEMPINKKFDHNLTSPLDTRREKLNKSMLSRASVQKLSS